MPLPDAADLETLVALARHGTLSAAAKKRGVAVSTLSRRIDALEARLGLALVDRRMRGARLTDAGRAIAAAAEPLSAQLDRIGALAASLAKGAPQRSVRVSATEMVVSDVLAPRLGELALTKDSPPVELRSEAEIVSLAARNADIAIRMSRPVGASLIIRKLPALTLSFYASRAYVDGRVVAFRDFGDERLLAYDDSYGPLPETAWIDQHRLGHAVRLRSGSTRALLTASLDGAGIALLPDAIATGYPELVAIPNPLRIPPRVPYLTLHRDLQKDRAVRTVANWAAGCFAGLVRRQAMSIVTKHRAPA